MTDKQINWVVRISINATMIIATALTTAFGFGWKVSEMKNEVFKYVDLKNKEMCQELESQKTTTTTMRFDVDTLQKYGSPTAQMAKDAAIIQSTQNASAIQRLSNKIDDYVIPALARIEKANEDTSARLENHIKTDVK